MTTELKSFEEYLEASPITRPMVLLWLLAAGLITLDGFDFFIIGVALPFLKLDFNLSSAEIGAVAVAAVAGSLVEPLSLGAITDRVGRQIMLVVDIALFVIATAGTALAWDAASLIFFRFLVGVAIGADYPISVSYITENVPSHWRGRMVVGAFTFQAVGALLGAITGLVIINFYFQSPQEAIRFAWRWMLGVGLILAIAVAIWRFSFRLESPRYYLVKGKYEEASEAASMLLNQPVKLTAATEPLQREPSLPYGSLFSAAYRRRIALAAVPWFLQDIATYGIGIFTPTIISALAFDGEENFLVREMAAAKGSALVDLFLIVGFLVAVFLVERWGRIKLQVVGFLGMAVGLLILAVGSQGQVWLVFLGFFVFNLMMNSGPNSTTFLLSGEVFPTAIRASGAGLAAAIAKGGAVLGTFALPIWQKSLGVPKLLLFLALVCVLGALLTYLWRVETTGRSLESISFD